MHVSARASLVRATLYYRTAEFFLRDRAGELRLKQTSDDMTATFRSASLLLKGIFTGRTPCRTPGHTQVTPQVTRRSHPGHTPIMKSS